MERLIIKKSKWIRGKSKAKSCLLRSTDKRMCCLGFLAKKLKYDDQEIIDIGTPWELTNLKLDKKLYNMYMNDLSQDFIDINDDRNISDVDRQKKLKKLFKEINIDVRFID